MSRDIFSYQNWGSAWYWVEVEYAAKPPTMHKTGPYRKTAIMSGLSNQETALFMKAEKRMEKV